jgi:hypothetical protein
MARGLERSQYNYDNSNGSVVFFTDSKPKGRINFYIEGRYVGYLDDYFVTMNPNCGQSGALTISLKPGNYTFTAKDSDRSWEGRITISGSRCSPIKLN